MVPYFHDYAAVYKNDYKLFFLVFMQSELFGS